jgi:hypothetical protein
MTTRLKEVEEGYNTLSGFIKDLIHSRKEEVKGMTQGGNAFQGRSDVFRLMVHASETGGKLSLTDEELVRFNFNLY